MVCISNLIQKKILKENDIEWIFNSLVDMISELKLFQDPKTRDQI
jgi:hypothetical protein